MPLCDKEQIAVCQWCSKNDHFDQQQMGEVVYYYRGKY